MTNNASNPRERGSDRRRRRWEVLLRVLRCMLAALVGGVAGGGALLVSGAAAAHAASAYPSPLPSFVSIPGADPRYTPANAATTRPLLVVVANETPDIAPAGASPAAVRSRAFGPAALNVANYYSRASGGRMTFTPATETCGTANDGVAVVTANHSGVPGDAEIFDLLARQGCVNWTKLDRNGNGRLDQADLTILVAFGLSTNACGQTRSTVVNGQVVDVAYVQGTANTITMAHEVGHATLGMKDLYGDGIGALDLYGTTCALPDSNGVVDTQTRDLSAASKLHLGWKGVSVATQDSFQDIYPADAGGRAWLLYDPDRGTQDYFMAEYRRTQPGTLDANASGTGLAIYRADTRKYGTQDPNVRDIEVMRSDGARDPDQAGGDQGDLWSGVYGSRRTMTRSWRDGTAAKVAVRAICMVGDHMRAYFDVRGTDGLLLDDQCRSDRFDVERGQKAATSFFVQNTGEVANTYTFATSFPTGWTANPIPNVTLNPGQAATIIVSGTPSASAALGPFGMLLSGQTTAGQQRSIVQLGGTVRPANDQLATPTALPGAAGTVTSTNVNATTESFEPNRSGGAPRPSVWFSWVAPETGLARFTTTSSGFDTRLAAYTGTTYDDLSSVAENDDDHPPSGASSIAFQATAGTAYRIAVDGRLGATGAIRLSWAQNGPSNDRFSGASTLAGDSGARSITTDRALIEVGDGSDTVRTVWFRYVPTHSGTATFSVPQGTFDSNLTVLTGTQMGSLTTKAYNLDYTAGSGLSKLSTPVDGGATYWVRVGVNGGDPSLPGGAATLEWALDAPANDDVYGPGVASLVGASVGVTDADNTNATAEPTEGSSNGDLPPKATLWWTWKADFDGPVTVATGGPLDTLLAVWTGAPGGLSYLVYDDDSGPGRSSVVGFQAVAGTTYYLSVDGKNGSRGKFDLSLHQGTSAAYLAGTDVAEGPAGTDRVAQLQLYLDGPQAQPVTIKVDSMNETATAGSDYVAIHQQVTFQPGEFSKLVSVTIHGDDVVEPDEAFTVTEAVTAGDAVAVGPGRVRILDDDAAPG